MEIIKKMVAEFEVGYLQFLNAEGKLIQNLPEFLQDPKQLIVLYNAMVEARQFDAQAILLQRTGRLGTYPSILGQEAIGVGIGAAMELNDVFCPYYRDCATQFWRGVKMSEVLLYWGGDERGSNFANNKHDFPICVPVASQSLYAIGVATAIKLKKQTQAVVTVLGDGGTSRGDFYEAINLAGIWHLPIVFIVNNNRWAISVPRAEQTLAATLAQKGVAAGISSEQVDGNDVIAVGYSVHKALERAKNGQGPSLIEALSYRLSDHTTADDAKRYRSSEELDRYRLEDPISRLAQYLRLNNLWNDEQEENLKEKVTSKVQLAIDEYLNIKPESPAAMFEHLYVKLPEVLKTQRDETLKLFGDT